MNKLPLFLLALSFGCASAPKQTAPQPAAVLPTTIKEAVNSPYRSKTNQARDQYRHPVEALEFFGLKSDMTVVEISPGAGWYLEILAPFLTQQGHYVAAVPPLSQNPEANAGTEAIDTWKKGHPEIKIATREFRPPDKLEIAPAGSVDMVLTFRNVHNWMKNDAAKAAFQEFFKALKPGGVLGLVEHRADPKGKRDKHALSGYVREKDVIALAESVGFKLDKKSEINANPKDVKNYPEGVWTLPPVLRLKDKGRDRYLAIGESDRMTLRFIKPAK